MFLHLLKTSDAHAARPRPTVTLRATKDRVAQVEILDNASCITLCFKTGGDLGGRITIVSNGGTAADDALSTDLVLGPRLVVSQQP